MNATANNLASSDAPCGIRSRPLWMILTLVLADLASLAAASFLSSWGRWLFDKDYELSLYLSLWPLLFLFVLIYAGVGLYSGLGMYPGLSAGPADELRGLTKATTSLFFVLGIALFLFRGGLLYSRSVFIMAWGLSVLFVPLGRAALRHFCANRSWWGYPTIVLGAGWTGHKVIRALQRDPHLGLKPVAVLDDDGDKHGTLCGVPVMGGLALAPQLAREMCVTHAIVAMPSVIGERRQELYRLFTQTFRHLLIVPDPVTYSSLWVVAKDIGGILGLEVRQRLLLRWPRTIKRITDLIAVVLGGVFLLLVLGIIALLIKLDSRGPIFYSQTRPGFGGKRFRMWKFRTMVANADEALREYLDRHPELHEEWRTTHKLKDDPRITRVGRWLRRLSLDELPQIWNVLCGEMSLVGPRPILEGQIKDYGARYELYCKVHPGLTGLWQVSGRNDTTHEERIELDCYYANNWSPWLDVYIMGATVGAILTAKGAY